MGPAPNLTKGLGFLGSHYFCYPCPFWLVTPLPPLSLWDMPTATRAMPLTTEPRIHPNETDHPGSHSGAVPRRTPRARRAFRWSLLHPGCCPPVSIAAPCVRRGHRTSTMCAIFASRRRRTARAAPLPALSPPELAPAQGGDLPPLVAQVLARIERSELAEHSLGSLATQAGITERTLRLSSSNTSAPRRNRWNRRAACCLRNGC